VIGTLRVLLVEDSENDAMLLLRELRRGGYQPLSQRVYTPEDMEEALRAADTRDEPFQVVISDYYMPRFSAPDALRLLRELGYDVPFIVVSGAIGEETAVELMRAGAHDYLLKDRLMRLTAAIEREIAQAAERSARRRAETLFQEILRSSPMPVAIIDRSTGRIVGGSSNFARQFLPEEDFHAALSLTEAIRFSHPERVEQLLAKGSGVAWYTVYYAGSLGHVANIRCYSVDHEGAQYAHVIIEDVTEQHYLKAAFDAVPNGVVVISSEDKLLYANRVAEELFGSLYFGTDVHTFLGNEKLGRSWWQRPTARFEERRLEMAGKPYEASSVSFRFPGEMRASTILTLRNVSEEEELLRLANHDALTGIYNLRFLTASLTEQIYYVAEGAMAVLALIDLDFFKSINDQWGHAAGDAALMTFSNIVRAELRASDVFARIGGDEFAILFPSCALAEAETTLMRIYERLARTPSRFEEESRPLSASCGVAALRAGETADQVRHRADRALYGVKRSGRGRFVVDE